jgi:hypothetical protein
MCAGMSDTLTLSGNSTTVQWQSSADSVNFNNLPGVTGNSYAVQPSHSTYYRVIAGSTTCADTSQAVKLTVNLLPSPSVPVAVDTIICSGDSTQICAAGNYSAYLWNTGETSACIEVRNAQGYWVSVTDANGCSASSAHTQINVYPVSSVSITVHGDTLSSFNAVSYQWLENGAPINGATSNFYVVMEPGNYAVQITDTNGCSSVSSPVYIAITGLGEPVIGSGINIYPNPFANSFFIGRTVETISLTGIEIYNVLGRTITAKYGNNLSANPLQISVTNLPGGIYYLKLILNNGTSYLQKLIKQ